MLDLNVEPSPSYRTWAFNTLRKQDRSGHMTLEVTDEAGKTLVSEKLPIKEAGRPVAKAPGTPRLRIPVGAKPDPIPLRG